MRSGRASLGGAIIVFFALLALVGGHSLGHASHDDAGHERAGHHDATHASHADGSTDTPAGTRDDSNPARPDTGLFAAACGFALLMIAACVRRRPGAERMRDDQDARLTQITLTPEPPVPKACFAA